MAGIVPELTHGVSCPGRGSFCPGNVKIDHRGAWIYGQKCTKSSVATRAAPFGSDMHQIVCWLGLRPIPHCGSLQRSPRPPSWIKGWAPKEREGGRGEEKEGGRENGGGVPECLNPELASLTKMELQVTPTRCIMGQNNVWCSGKKPMNRCTVKKITV